jgi:hypothetical protein
MDDLAHRICALTFVKSDSFEPDREDLLTVGCEVFVNSGALRGVRGVIVKESLDQRCYVHMHGIANGILLSIDSRYLTSV